MTAHRLAPYSTLSSFALLALLTSAGAATLRAQTLDTVRIRTTDLGGSVYLLHGAGGNVGVFAGSSAVLLVDAQFAPLADRILAAVGELTDAPVRYVINTHWHPDHVGGNAPMARVGATLISQAGTARRMAAPQYTEFFGRTTPAATDHARPAVTFVDSISIRVDGETITAFHVDSAHTDGDAVVRFARANVVQMGDLYFSAQYPFIDLSSGGTVEGMIRAADAVLALSDTATRVIPGHGPVATRAQLAAYRAMLAGVRDSVARLVAGGAGLDAVVAARPAKAFDAAWGNGWMKSDQFIRIVYQDQVRQTSR